jgi:hypothetical protein
MRFPETEVVWIGSKIEHVYVALPGGEKIDLTDFMRITRIERDQLIGGGPEIQLTFRSRLVEREQE